MNIWRLETYNALVGESITLAELETGNECKATVEQVVESPALGDGWESFSVVMNCDAQIEQGSFNVSHSEHGSTTIFVSANSQTQLESVFNYDLSKL